MTNTATFNFDIPLPIGVHPKDVRIDVTIGQTQISFENPEPQQVHPCPTENQWVSDEDLAEFDQQYLRELMSPRTPEEVAVQQRREQRRESPGEVNWSREGF